MILLDWNGVAIANALVQKSMSKRSDYHVDFQYDSDVDATPQFDINLVRFMILNSLRIHKAKHQKKFGDLVICVDGANNWRKKYFPYYKQNRKKASASLCDWNQLFECTNQILDELREHFPYKVIVVDGCEADDIIGTLVQYTHEEFGAYEPNVIISNDTDFIQLQQYRDVKQWAPVKSKWIESSTPKADLLEKILKGESTPTGDGIPNVLSDDDCLVNDDKRQTPLRANIKKKLINDPKSMGVDVYRNFQRNSKLIDLSQTPVALKKDIINTFHAAEKKDCSRGDLITYLTKNRCARLLENVGDFV